MVEDNLSIGLKHVFLDQILGHLQTEVLQIAENPATLMDHVGIGSLFAEENQSIDESVVNEVLSLIDHIVDILPQNYRSLVELGRVFGEEKPYCFLEGNLAEVLVVPLDDLLNQLSVVLDGSQMLQLWFELDFLLKTSIHEIGFPDILV